MPLREYPRGARLRANGWSAVMDKEKQMKRFSIRQQVRAALGAYIGPTSPMNAAQIYKEKIEAPIYHRATSPGSTSTSTVPRASSTDIVPPSVGTFLYKSADGTCFCESTTLNKPDICKCPADSGSVNPGAANSATCIAPCTIVNGQCVCPPVTPATDWSQYIGYGALAVGGLLLVSALMKK